MEIRPYRGRRVTWGIRVQSDVFLDEQLPAAVVKTLLARGTDRPGPANRHEQGLANDCHENARAMAARDGYAWWFGLALSSDGRWRVHSWCVMPNDELIETTGGRRVCYFGMPMPAGAHLGPLKVWRVAGRDYPLGDARRAFLAVVALLRGESPTGVERWEEDLLP